MTVVMELLHGLLPAREQHPLPPRHVTERVLEAADLHDDLTEGQKQQATLANHYAYGTGAGGVYGLLAPHLPFGPAVNGIGYGLGVWAASYLGLLPAAGLYPPATEEHPGRNALMIAAHVVWGATLGLVHRDLAGDEGDREFPTIGPGETRVDGRTVVGVTGG
jgi:hypothetical protein